MSISANITLPVLKRYLNRFGLVRTAMERATAETFRKRLAIRTASVDLPVAKLSGGNQQKVMLSKWLNTKPSVLILDEPTRGIDVGAKAEVHTMIGELAAEGIGIILISSELPEVLAMSDRVLVMREGRQMAIFRPRRRHPGIGDDGGHGAGRRIERQGRGMNWLQRHVRPEQVREFSLLLLIIAAVLILRLAHRQLLHVAHLQPHRLERRDHHHRRGRPDPRRPHPQHRPVGRLDRRLLGLFRRHAPGAATTISIRSSRSCSRSASAA